MKKQAILGTLIAATVLQSPLPAFADKRDVGNIIGGIIGGAIGSQIGGGRGKTAATIIGAIAGSAIGRKIGRKMDQADHRALEEAQRDCLNRDLGSRVDWDGRRYGSRSGARGNFTSTREGYNPRTGEYCRQYESVIYVDGYEERTSGFACTRQDGSWYETRGDEMRFDEAGLSNRRPPRYPGPGYGPVRPGRPGRPPRPVHPLPPPAPGYPPPPAPGYPPPPHTQPGEFTSVAQINSISRRSGGQWYRLSLQRPMSVSSIHLHVLRANVRLHETSLVTDYGQRMPLFELSNTPVLGQNATLSSYVNRNERIVAIDIRAESFGAYADVMVNVGSREGYPSLVVVPY